MANWVQNVIVIYTENFVNAKTDRRLKLLLKNIQNMSWMGSKGFREQIDQNGFFGVSTEIDGSITVYADTKWKPPFDVFDEWASKGLIFSSYYYDIESHSFVGKWCSTGLSIHFEMAPQNVTKYIKQLKEVLPDDINKRFGVIDNLIDDLTDTIDIDVD